MPTRLVLVLTSAVLVLAACGGGSSKTKAASTTTTTTAGLTAPGGPSTTGGAGAASDSPDVALAKRLVYQADEVPAGWTVDGEVTVNDPGADPQGKALAGCVGRPDPATFVSADVVGPSFTMGDDLDARHAGSSANIVRSPDDARADISAFRSTRFLPCLRQQLSKSLEDAAPGLTVADVNLDSLPVPTTDGDATLAYRFTASAGAAGTTTTLYVDVVFMEKSRAEMSLTFTGIGGAFPTEVENALTAKVGARVKAL